MGHSMNHQETNHDRIDPASRFWIDNEGAAATSNTVFEDLEDDVQSAVREAGERSVKDSEIEAALPFLESLREGFGTVPAALKFNNALTQSYRADPAAANRDHRRYYEARLFEVPPEKKPPEAAPADLTEQARDEWEREQAVRSAVKSAADEAAFKKEIEEAAPLLAQIRQEYGPLTKPLEVAAAIHQAMTIRPQVADKITSMMNALGPAPHEVAQAQDYYEKAQTVKTWVDQVRDSGSLPGIERPEIESAVCDQLEQMNARGEAGSFEQRLVTAYSRAMTAVRAEQDHATAERARHASRSLSGGPPQGEHVLENNDDDFMADTRRAYRSVMAA